HGALPRAPPALVPGLVRAVAGGAGPERGCELATDGLVAVPLLLAVLVVPVDLVCVRGVDELVAEQRDHGAEQAAIAEQAVGLEVAALDHDPRGAATPRVAAIVDVRRRRPAAAEHILVGLLEGLLELLVVVLLGLLRGLFAAQDPNGLAAVEQPLGGLADPRVGRVLGQLLQRVVDALVDVVLGGRDRVPGLGLAGGLLQRLGHAGRQLHGHVRERDAAPREHQQADRECDDSAKHAQCYRSRGLADQLARIRRRQGSITDASAWPRTRRLASVPSRPWAGSVDSSSTRVT